METLITPSRTIGPGEEPYIIAEIGANHNGDMALCRDLVDAAAGAGAHAVKFQSWTATSLISEAEYARNTRYSDPHRHFGSLREMVEKYQLSPADHAMIADHCRARGIDFCSSAFSPREVDLLLSLRAPFVKIASMDVNNRPLLEYVGATGCQVILSTGMADMAEIARAVTWLREAGGGPICLLHCVSIYPPRPETINLRNIQTLARAFDVPVGLSDHTLGTAVPLAAVALGACVVEKHFTLDTSLPGWDHAISATPGELAALARECRVVFQALGVARRVVSGEELAKRRAFRRRIVLRAAKGKGEAIAFEDLDFKRPGTGIAPDEYPYVVGRLAARDLEAGAELEWSDLV
ncbi:N-acetylneuraminate synthase family protein [Desulfolutivibrio sulfoxidireducens]|uniref:N-acetylneuraminate synthase family protein n=1 Tax=Desulfolutivibrio sulfoxidireducens TaxID=2773299 RepID=UPI00159E10B8|nr:N-acetylneuraminate synthase family protein [Desulfolutivibrio sulfoxidireducens]QLA17067.1 polysaccharide biosynthesis protein [Desulfolutivibrio sulfoxidireducens]